MPLTFLLATVSMLDTSLRVNAVQPRSTSSRGMIASLGIVTAAYLISGFVDREYAVAYALFLLGGLGREGRTARRTPCRRRVIRW